MDWPGWRRCDGRTGSSVECSSGADFVYVFMRTAADPADPEDQDKARAVMEAASIDAKGGGTFHSDWDPDEVIAMRREIIFGATYTDSLGAFGDVEGWLAHPTPVRSSANTTPDENGTLTFHFGCGDDALNNIDITENWTYILRLYGPREPILNGTYQPVIPRLVA